MSSTNPLKRPRPVGTDLETDPDRSKRHEVELSEIGPDQSARPIHREKVSVTANLINPLTQCIIKKLGFIRDHVKEDMEEFALCNNYVPDYAYYSSKHVIKTKSRGDIRYRDLITKLSMFDTGEVMGWTRSNDQKLFHDDFIEASIKVIYGEEYRNREMEIIKNMGWTSTPQQEVCIACPRRFGKSVALIMFIVAALLSLPKVKIVIFSPTARQSENVSREVRKCLIEILKGDKRLKKKTLEMIVVAGDSESDQRELYALPSNPDGTRGVTADIIVIDEAAYVDQELILQVVYPLLQVGKTSLLAVSTLKDDDSTYSHMISLTDTDGEYIFKSRVFKLACNECMEKGDPSGCTHQTHRRPNWHDSARIKRLSNLYKNNKELMGQEIYGLSHSKNQKAYTPAQIELLMDQPKLPVTLQVSRVFIAIDPSGGGASSNTCICSGYFTTNGIMVLLGLENIPVKRAEDYLSVLDKHLAKINSFKKFRFSKLIFILENNMGLEADHINDHIKKLPYPSIAVEGKEGKTGLHTSPKVKQALHVMMEKTLKAGNLRFSELFFTHGDMSQLKMDIVSQLESFKIVVEVNSKSVFARARTTFSGKGGGGKDDIVLGMQLLLYWAQNIEHQSRFRNYMAIKGF